MKDKDREEFLRKTIKLAEEKLKLSGIDYGNSGTCVLCISARLSFSLIFSFEYTSDTEI